MVVKKNAGVVGREEKKQEGREGAVVLRESERERERELLVEGGRRTAAADRVGGLGRQAAAPGRVCVTWVSRGSTSEAILGLARTVRHVAVGATVGPG